MNTPLRSVLPLLFIVACTLGTGSCHDDLTTPQGLAATAANAVSRNDLKTFRATLHDNEFYKADAADIWGTPEGIAILRAEIANYDDVNIDRIKDLGAPKDIFDKPLNGLRLYAALLTGKRAGQVEKLIRIAIECQDRGACLITRIELYRCDALSSPEATFKTFTTALAHDDQASYRSALSDPALQEFGSAEKMKELNADSAGKTLTLSTQHVLSIMDGEKPIARAEGRNTTHSVAIHSISVELLTAATPSEKTTHDLNVLFGCVLEPAATCSTRCTITGFEPAGIKGPAPKASGAHQIELYPAVE